MPREEKHGGYLLCQCFNFLNTHSARAVRVRSPEQALCHSDKNAILHRGRHTGPGAGQHRGAPAAPQTSARSLGAAPGTRGTGSTELRARTACRGQAEKVTLPGGAGPTPGSARRRTARGGREALRDPQAPRRGSAPRGEPSAPLRAPRGAQAPGPTAAAPRPPTPGRGAARGVRQGGAPQAGAAEREGRLTQEGKAAGPGMPRARPPRAFLGPPRERPGTPGLTCAASGGRRARAGRSRGRARVRERRVIDGTAAPPPAGGAR